MAILANDIIARAQVIVVRVKCDNLTDADIARRVLFAKLVERCPAADVGPARIDGDDDDPVGALHHRIIDGVRRAGKEGLRARMEL